MPLLIPDIDLYFDGSDREVKSLVAQIEKSSANCLKLALCCKNPVHEAMSPLDQWHDPDGNKRTETLFNTFNKRIIEKDKALELFQEISGKFKHFICSVYDHQAIDVSSQFCSALKISSSNIWNLPLIIEASKNTNVLYLDTGSFANEIVDVAVATLDESNFNGELILQYSPPRPPAKASKWNLNRIPELQSRYGLKVGLSEHSNSHEQALIAIGLGAESIEKGVMSENKYRDGVSDSGYCIPISQLSAFSEKVHRAFKSLKTLETRPSLEPDTGVYAARNLPVSHVIGPNDVIVKYPCKGLSSSKWHSVIGKSINKKVSLDEPIAKENLRDM